MKNWEALFAQKIAQVASSEDPAHDLQHFRRVVKTAKLLCAQEQAREEVVVPAAWLHDLVIVPKNDPRRSQASRLSAEAALKFLTEIDYPEEHHPAIAHAITCHSYSANIPAETIEAQIVQDADRLDGLGAIGIARCFATAGLMKRSFYNAEDPFCVKRAPDDQTYTVDHFYQKLFVTAESLKTKAGRSEGARRVQKMREFLLQIADEIQ